MKPVPLLRGAAAWLGQRRPLLFHGIFWSWNLIFLSLVFFGFLPNGLWPLLCGLFDNDVAPSMAVGAALLLIIPIVATAVGFRYFRGQPAALVRLFYGVEAPFFLVTMMRVFLVRELTPGVDYLIALVSVCLVSYGYTIAFPGRMAHGWRGALQLAGQTLMLLACVHVALLATFYAVPLGWFLIKGFFSFKWVSGFFEMFRYAHGPWLLLGPLMAILVVFSASLFVAMPVVLLGLYGAAFHSACRSYARRHGAALCAALVLLTVVPCAGLYALLNRQPQARAFALLRDPPRDDAGRQALLARAGEVRKGLLNAYLAPYRYLGATGSNDHIVDLYAEAMKVPRPVGEKLQRFYNLLAWPVLYDGERLHSDQHPAETAYEAFFDEPLQKAERQAIRHAQTATFERDRREASLLSTDERKVWLVRQELRVHPSGDLAEIELHEVYENQTVEQQEILYYFSLPQSAALTGLWLGETEREADRYPFIVAPRGAAQKVYRAEVRRRQDPALLEQLGPRQYRLRAFPIPPRTRAREIAEGKTLGAPRFHLWLRYRALLGQNDEWPLPRLRERRNIYFTAATERVYPGGVAVSAEDWLPQAVPAGRVQRTAHALAVPPELGLVFGGREATVEEPWVLVATPQSAGAGKGAEDLGFLRGQALAVVLDCSYSMRRHQAEVREALSWLRRGAAGVDLYLTAAPSRGEGPALVTDLAHFDERSLVYYGGQKAGTLLQQFAALRGERRYAAILVLTDDGSMDLADDSLPADFAARVVLMHLGGRLPPGYDDATLETVGRRGGAVVTSLPEAIGYLRVAAGPDFVGWDGGYRFTLERRRAVAEADPFFAPIAARQVIQGAMVELAADSPERLAQLDRLHRLAKQHQVVTPYSSMIVLVDERQREALRKAEQEKDRFQREVEEGRAPLSPPGDLMSVTATPEPEEWLLLLLVGTALLWAWRRRRDFDGTSPA